MSLFSVVKLELLKLLYRKTTLLSALNFANPLIFGIGMIFGLSFLVVEDVYAVSRGLSAMDFTVEMLGQTKYLMFFVAIILAAISVASELENGQMKLGVIRICSRSKILIAKYLALLFVLGSLLLLFILWSLMIYLFMLICNSPFANGNFFSGILREQIYFIFFTFVGVAISVAATILFGLKLKTFPCFAVSYITWFTSLYSDFFKGLRLFIPNNLPDYALEQAGNAVNFLPYAALFTVYCVVMIAVSVVIFQRMDIKV